MPTEPTPPMATPDPDKEEEEPDDGGKVGRYLRSMFGKSWKTTAAGFLSVACGIIMGLNVALPGQLPPLLVALAGVAGPMIGGIGLMFSKDHNVHGGTKVIPSDPA